MTEQLALNRIADSLDKIAANSTPSPSPTPTPTPSAQNYNEIVSVEFEETMTFAELNVVIGELVNAVFGHLGATNDEEVIRKFMNSKIIVYPSETDDKMIFTPVQHSYYDENVYIYYSWVGMYVDAPATLAISINLNVSRNLHEITLFENQFVLSPSDFEAVTGRKSVYPSIPVMPEPSSECTCFPSVWKVVTTDTVETGNYTPSNNNNDDDIVNPGDIVNPVNP